MIFSDWPLGADHLSGVNQRDFRCINGSAIGDAHDHVLRNVNQTSRQVTGVCSTERRVGQALARAVRGDEVLEHRHPFAEVRLHWDVNDATRRIGHQSAHGAELADVSLVSACARVRHHQERVELRILVALLRVELRHHGVADLAGRLLPESNHVLVALVFRDQALGVLAVNLGDILVRLGDDRLLPLCHRDVEDGDRHATACCRLESDALDAVGEDCRLDLAEQFEGSADQLAQVGACHLLVHEAEAVWKDLVELDATNGGLHALLNNGVRSLIPDAGNHVDWSVHLHLAELVSEEGLGLVGEAASLFVRLKGALLRQVEAAEHHVLRWGDDRRAVRW